MNKFSFKVLVLLGAFGIMQACTDLDEELRDNVISPPETPGGGGPGGGSNPIGGPYTRLYGTMNHQGYFTLQGMPTDELMVPQRGGDWFDGGILLRLHNHTYLPGEGYFDGVWTNCYQGINDINELLVNPTITGAVNSEALISELKVLRAYFYFRLVDLFGNVKIPTETNKEVPQSTRQQIYDFVVSQIEDNIDNLSVANDASTYGRVNRWAALAMLAKIYLNAEVYTGTAQWAKAEAASDEIINNGPFGMEAKYFDVFKAKNEFSREHIWVVPYDRALATGFNMPQMTLHYASQLTYNLQQQPWNGYCTLEEFYNSYDDADERKANNFIAGVQKDINGQPLIDVSFEKNDPDGGVLTFTPKVNEFFPNALRQAGARIGKYQFVKRATPDLDNDFPIFRYADILLTKAEAAWRQNAGSTVALELVNQVRRRGYGKDPLTADPAVDFASLTATNLLAERGRETFAECWRRQDLIRFGEYSNKLWFGKTAPSAPFRTIFPIPQNQINASNATANKLNQNPGY